MARTAHLDTFTRDNLPPREEWPELLFELPELQYPERLNCAAELLDGMVTAGHGARVALREPGIAFTYRQVLERSNRSKRPPARSSAIPPSPCSSPSAPAPPFPCRA